MTSMYDDPEIAKMVRETDALYEQMRREAETLPLSEQHEEWEKPREQRQAELREFKARLKRFEEGTRGGGG